MEIGFTIASGSGSGELNGIVLKLQVLELSADEFFASDPVNTIIGTIKNKLPRSTLEISPADSRFVIDEDDNLVIGPSLSTGGTVIDVTIVETLPEALNSPRRTTLTVIALTGTRSPSLDLRYPSNSQYIGQVI